MSAELTGSITVRQSAAPVGRGVWRWLPVGGFVTLSVALALAGFGVAMYLTVVHFAHSDIACRGVGDCDYVNSTKYAKLAEVPVALIGAVAYATIAGTATAAWFRRDALLLAAGWCVALSSLAFSMYLTYIELRVIDAICVYCVASAAIVTALFVALSGAVWSTWSAG